MEAYVHVEKSGSKVAVGVVIREQYTTLRAYGRACETDDMWEALRLEVLELLKRNRELTIYTPLQGAETATTKPAWKALPQWKPIIEALRRTGSIIKWGGHAMATTGSQDARAKAMFFL